MEVLFGFLIIYANKSILYGGIVVCIHFNKEYGGVPLWSRAS